jgi:hypothetical protein
MNTSELDGPALDWAVAKCEGDTGAVALEAVETFLEYRARYGTWNYSIDWSQGGPLIERNRIVLDFFPDGCSEHGGEWLAQMFDANSNCYAEEMGNTPLIAAMRCYVASRLGDTVDIPEELT